MALKSFNVVGGLSVGPNVANSVISTNGGDSNIANYAVNTIGYGNVSLGAVANLHITGGNANAAVLGTVSLNGDGNVTAIAITSRGDGYTIAPTITISGANSGAATATANLYANGAIDTITITAAGTGYSSGTVSATASAPASKYLKTDGAGNLTWNEVQATGGGGGGGTPGGANTQVQFNDGGAFGGSNVFTFDKSTNVTTFGSNANSQVQVGASGNLIFTANNGTNVRNVTLKASTDANFSGNYSITLPANAGSNNQFLSTNGSGVTSWKTIATVADEWHVATNGNDTTGNGSVVNPYLTIGKALTSVGSSLHNVIVVHPGTYTENVTVTGNSVTITGTAEAADAVHLDGNLTFTGSASYNYVSGLLIGNLIHGASGSLYVYESVVGSTAAPGTVSKTGSGYFEMNDCDLQTGNVANGVLTSVSITGAGTVNLDGVHTYNMTVNNSGAIVLVNNSLSAVNTTLTAGNLVVADSFLYANGTGNIALTATGGVVQINGSSVVNPDLTTGKISIGASAVYGYENIVFDRPNSTLSGTSLALTGDFQRIRADQWYLGTSNIAITNNGNISFSANSNASIATIVGTGNANTQGVIINGIVNAYAYANGNSKVQITSNANVAISANGNIVANITSSGDGNLQTTGGNVTGYWNVSGNAVAANFVGTLANGNSNIRIAANGGVGVSATGQSNIIAVTSNGTFATTVISNDVTVTGNLTVQGNAIYANTESLTIEDPIIELGTGANGVPLTTNDGKDRGVELHTYGTGGTLTTNGSTPSGNTTIAFTGSNAAFAVGQVVGYSANPNAIAAGTTVTTVNASNIVISAATLATIASGESLQVGKDLLRFMGWSNANAEFQFYSNATITNEVVSGTLGNVNANYFLGNFVGSLVNGNSNVSVAANSNVTIGVAGNAAILTVTGTGTNVAGYLNVTGNSLANNFVVNNTVNFSNGNVANTSTYFSNIGAATLTTTATTADQVIVKIPSAVGRSVEFIVKGADSTGSLYVRETISVIVTATGTLDYTTYGVVGTTQSPAATLNVALTDTNANIALQVTPYSTNSTVWTTQYQVI